MPTMSTISPLLVQRVRLDAHQVELLGAQAEGLGQQAPPSSATGLSSGETGRP